MLRDAYGFAVLIIVLALVGCSAGGGDSSGGTHAATTSTASTTSTTSAILRIPTDQLPPGTASLSGVVKVLDPQILGPYTLTIASGQTFQTLVLNDLPLGQALEITLQAIDASGNVIGTLVLDATTGRDNNTPLTLTFTSFTNVRQVVSLAVTPSSPKLDVGVKQAFTAAGSYSDNTTQDLTAQVTWTSSAADVATIDASGTATTLAAGTTTISATLGAVSGSTTLSVNPPAPTVSPTPSAPSALSSIAVNGAAKPLNQFTTQNLTATGTYADGSKDITGQVAWGSTQPNVATVNAAGQVVTNVHGTTVISATDASSGIVGTANVSVNPMILVADTGNSRLVGMSVSGGQITQFVTLASSIPQASAATTAMSPCGVAVDATGNIYVLEVGPGDIQTDQTASPGPIEKLTYAGGKWTTQTLYTNMELQYETQLPNLAADAQGNLFVAVASGIFRLPSDPLSTQPPVQVDGSGSTFEDSNATVDINDNVFFVGFQSSGAGAYVAPLNADSMQVGTHPYPTTTAVATESFSSFVLFDWIQPDNNGNAFYLATSYFSMSNTVLYEVALPNPPGAPTSAPVAITDSSADPSGPLYLGSPNQMTADTDHSVYTTDSTYGVLRISPGPNNTWTTTQLGSAVPLPSGVVQATPSPSPVPNVFQFPQGIAIR